MKIPIWITIINRNILFAFLVAGSASAVAQPADQTGRIYISKDQGVNWERADKGFPTDDQVNAWVTTDGLVLAGTNSHGVFISADQMKSWYSSTRGLPKNTRVISMAVYRNTILAGTNAGGIYRSDDKGESWTSCNTGLQSLVIRAFFVNGSLLFAGTNGGIYSSSDHGKSWTSRPNVCLQINAFSSSGDHIFAATHLGLLKSSDQGMTWTSVYKDGAVDKLATWDKKIFIMGYDGLARESDITSFMRLNTNLFQPFQGTFRLTASSPRELIAPWKNVIRSLNAPQPSFLNSGLPEKAAFTELLNTPFGILTAAILPCKKE